LLHVLKQNNVNVNIPADMDLDATLNSQATRPSIFISDHDTASLLQPELNYSTSMSSLSTQLQLSPNSFIGGVSGSPGPSSPIPQLQQLGTQLHHSTSSPSLQLSASQQQQQQLQQQQQRAQQQARFDHHQQQAQQQGQQQQQQQHGANSAHQSSQQSLRTALAGGDSLSVYGRAVASPLSASPASPSALSGISGSQFYSTGPSTSLSSSSLGSADMKDLYSR
ncbi:hypothetical protein FBU59_006141, partial [Linderina macrospora]